MSEKHYQKFSELKPDRILIIRTDRIGDLILTLPMVDTLKRNYPNALIDMLVNKRTAELLSDYANINKVHSIEKDSLNAVRNLCRLNKYDLAVVVYPRFSIALALYLSGIKYRLGTAYRWYSFLFNIRHHQHRKYSTKHELEYNLGLLDVLDCKRIDDVTPKLYVAPVFMERVKGKLSAMKIDTNKKFIIIHIFSMGSAKVWGQHNFVKLCNMLIDDNKCDFNIILSGTRDDEPELNRMMKYLNPNNKIFAVFGLNLSEFAALIKLASLFISNSTGPIHIAAAVGTFVIGFYSPLRTESAVRWGPYTDRKKIFTPLADANEKDVMDSIKPETVLSFIKEFMIK